MRSEANAKGEAYRLKSGNANLPIGGFLLANREIGVPGRKLQAIFRLSRPAGFTGVVNCPFAPCPPPNRVKITT